MSQYSVELDQTFLSTSTLYIELRSSHVRNCIRELVKVGDTVEARWFMEDYNNILVLKTDEAVKMS